MSKKGLIYIPQFIRPKEKKEIFEYLASLYPIWEMRFSDSNPPPEGQTNRRLLRPVYWLGNWQFACLDYYHPPKGLYNRCVTAEPFPPVFQQLISTIESMVHDSFPERDIPHDWHLNTCLINYYGTQVSAEKKDDVARVGEHKDFEPGPVASISFGEKALFQFVKSESRQQQSQVFLQQWLEDSSLQIFGSDLFKKKLFHRVQRVEKKLATPFVAADKTYTDQDWHTENFQTRRINFTFRYVPTDHFVRYKKMPQNLQQDIKTYVEELAQHSDYFKNEFQSIADI